ncbi:unnamed protein product [Plutella xylostella]|uniref:(diamondback moth) hypothetical protein n=1 Tax=Plutella xylostella TaxID=51655 RepID=A0A8S4G6D4_PLUXY|nr:unnamed protein product [Plutella xylostella]
MDDLLAFEFLEMDYAISNTNRRRKRKRIRDECDPFSLEDSEFRRRYRLSKDLTESLIEDLGSMFNEPRKLSDLSITDKRPTGDIAAHSMAQQTVSKCIAQVTTAMNSLAMRQKHIVFPHDLQDGNLIRADPEVAASIVNACVILHNMCTKARLPVVELDANENLLEAQYQKCSEAVQKSKEALNLYRSNSSLDSYFNIKD